MDKKHYSEYTVAELFKYDFSIASHPYIDACNASIIYHLINNLKDKDKYVVLDGGCGSGQVSRLLLGINNVIGEAADIDPEAEKYFKLHPETKNIKYHDLDLIFDELPRNYDAIILRGVYHHIAKSERGLLLKNLLKHTNLIIIADEGILEYVDEKERLRNCQTWYSFVIEEAERRGLVDLVNMETTFFEHEKLNTADDGGDLKESPLELIKDANYLNISNIEIFKYGNWDNLKGGFYTAIIKK